MLAPEQFRDGKEEPRLRSRSVVLSIPSSERSSVSHCAKGGSEIRLPRHLISQTLAGEIKGMGAASKTEHCCFDVQHFIFDVFFYLSFHAKFEMRTFGKLRNDAVSTK